MVASVKIKGALRRLHLGPGPHPSGSPQSVHAGNGAVAFDQDRLEDLARAIPDVWSIRKDERAHEYIALSMEARLGREISVNIENINKVKYNEGFVIRDGDGNELTIQMGQASGLSDRMDEREIILSYIVANNKGTGLGSAFMDSMKDYGDLKGQNFRIINVTNPKFYNVFGGSTKLVQLLQ